MMKTRQRGIALEPQPAPDHRADAAIATLME
jgi:hypothetical protein